MKLHTNRDWLNKMYIDNDLSQRSIAKICGVNQSTIHYFLVRFNIPRRKFCGRSGFRCHLFKGGRIITSQGYMKKKKKGHPRAFKTRPYVPEQILIVEKHLGRFLSKEETVHHIDEVKLNNNPANLYLFSGENEHQRYHMKLRRKTIEPITKSNLL